MKRKVDCLSVDFPARKIANLSDYVVEDNDSENCVVILLHDFSTNKGSSEEQINDDEQNMIKHYQQLLYNKFQMQSKGKIKWLEYKYECMARNNLKYIPIEFCKDTEYLIHTLNVGKMKLDEELFNLFHPSLLKPMFLLEIIERLNNMTESRRPNVGVLGKLMKFAADVVEEGDVEDICIMDANGMRLPDFMNRICFSNEEELDNENYVLQNISTDGTVKLVDFMKVSNRLQNDHKFMIELFKKFKFTIESAMCVGTELKSNKQFLLELANITPYAMVLASTCAELKSDKSFIMELISINPQSIKFYRSNGLTRNEILQEMKENIIKNQLDKLEKDKEFIIKSLLIDIELIEYVSPTLLNDRDFMLEAVQQISKNRNYLPYKFYSCDELRDNSEYMFKCIAITDVAFQYVSERLRNDKDFILEALKLNYSIYRYIDVALLTEDRNFLFKCLAITGRILKKADIFKADEEVVLAALKSDGSMIRYADSSLRTDKEFVIRAKRNANLDICFLPDVFKDDRNFILEYFNPDNYSDVTFIIESDYYEDEEFLMELLKKGFKYTLLPQNMMDSIECVKIAVGLNGTVLKKVDEDFQNDKEIQKIAIKSNGYYLSFAQDLLDYRMNSQYFGCYI